MLATIQAVSRRLTRQRHLSQANVIVVISVDQSLQKRDIKILD